MSNSYDRISIYGMYQYDDTILNNLSVPTVLSDQLETIKKNILLEGAELELMYTDLDFLKFAIGTWSVKKVPVWEKMYTALSASYNPIENYDRKEDFTDTRNTETNKDIVTAGTSHDGTESSNSASSQTSSSGNTSNTGTVGNAGTTQNDVNGYDIPDSPTLATHDKQTTNNTETRNLAGTSSETGSASSSATGAVVTNSTNSSRTDDDTNEEMTFEHHARTHGNIGVTTNQQMLESEINLRAKYNIVDIIVNDFIRQFCLRVY